MILEEYSFEEHVERVQRHSYAEGREDGSMLRMIDQICKKLRKNKSIETIADEIEEDAFLVEQVAAIAKDFAPDYDAEKIYERFQNGDKGEVNC